MGYNFRNTEYIDRAHLMSRIYENAEPFTPGVIIDIIESEPEVNWTQWEYDPTAIGWGTGGWVCRECHIRNNNISGKENENPYLFAGSRFCPSCGRRAKKIKPEKDPLEVAHTKTVL